MTARVTAVVPTLGVSPLLEECLAALRSDGGSRLRIVVVRQGLGGDFASGLADELLEEPSNLGFARATNLGVRHTETEFLATVNDDAVVGPGWCSALLAVLDAEPQVAAVQGVNLQLASPKRVDGCGIGWNRRREAVQLGLGEPAPPPHAPTREVFGVSATAAIYRCSALAGLGREPFEARLGSYYEDVELAIVLRAAGFSALLVPAARARHAGSLTGLALGRERLALIHGNRLLVLARLLGRAFWPRLPGLLLRDMLATTRRSPAAVLGLLQGWARAAPRLKGFAGWGPPLLPLSELERFGFEKAP
jgi:GT2 family glycosyltransferase